MTVNRPAWLPTTSPLNINWSAGVTVNYTTLNIITFIVKAALYETQWLASTLTHSYFQPMHWSPVISTSQFFGYSAKLCSTIAAGRLADAPAGDTPLSGPVLSSSPLPESWRKRMSGRQWCPRSFENCFSPNKSLASLSDFLHAVTWGCVVFKDALEERTTKTPRQKLDFSLLWGKRLTVSPLAQS